MSKASYWQRGETLDYKNTGSSTIEANTVVELTGRVGIAGTDIAPGAEGDLHVCGVFEFDKTGTNEIAFGQPVYFDKTGITDAADNGETSGSKVAYTPAGFAAQGSGRRRRKGTCKNRIRRCSHGTGSNIPYPLQITPV